MPKTDDKAYREKQSQWGKHLSMRQNQLRARETACEKTARRGLEALNVTFHFQKGYFCKWTGIRIVDFYLPKPFRMAIEIDGPNHKEDEDRRREHQIRLGSRRLAFLRIKNAAIMENKGRIADYMMERINEMLAKIGKTIRLERKEAA